MIISRKKFNQELQEAVSKVLCEAAEKRWTDERIRDMNADFNRRIDRVCEKIERLERHAFPEEFKSESRCAVDNTPICRY